MDPTTPIIYNNLETSKRKRSCDCCWLVPMIIVANFVIFIIVMFINNCPHNHTNCVAPFLGRFSFQPSSENPFLGPSFSTLFKMGALQWDKVVNQHQGWRLITCIWLHAGILHLLLNMFSLAIIALYGRLEQQFGFVRIGILYLVSGLGGSVLSSLFLGQAITFGASGALFGLLGAMLSEVITNWTIYANKAAALIPILIMIALNFVIGMLPHFNHFAPVGGFLSGFLLGFVLLLRPRYGWIKVYRLPEDERPQSKYYMTYQIVLLFIAAVALITGFTVALVMLFQGKNGYDHCKWCRYLNY